MSVSVGSILTCVMWRTVKERDSCKSTEHGAIMCVSEQHLNRCGHHLYISTVDVTGKSPRATVRKCDYHLCISTIIVWEQCTEKSINISVLKQLKQVQLLHASSEKAALKQTTSLVVF